MKSLLTTAICLLVFFGANAQKVVYSDSKSKIPYTKETTDLYFEESTIEIPKELGEQAGFSALIPTVVDLGFKIAEKSLEARLKKFSGEYVAQSSYLKASGKKIPHLEFVRQIDVGEGMVDAIQISLKAKKVDKLDGFYYYIESLKVIYSKAKVTSKSKIFDYSIEIKPTFYVFNDKGVGEKKAQELSPIKISSVSFNDNELNLKDRQGNYRYRTEIIPLPKGSYFSEASIKIIEANPAKLKAEKILELFNTYKGEAKTVINNFVKTEDSSSDDNASDSGDSEGSEGSDDPNEPVGNDGN